MRFWSIAAVGESSMRLLLIVATAWSLCTGPAFAQVEDPLDPLTAVPSLSATSPLGIGTNGSVGTTGIPMGATEINSAGVSPASTGSVTGTIAIPTSGAITTSGTACPTGGMSAPGTSTSSEMSVPLGMSTSSGMLDTSGMSGMCGSGSTSTVSSSTPTSTSKSPTAPGGAA